MKKKFLKIPLTILGLRMKHEVIIALGLMVIQFIYHFASKSWKSLYYRLRDNPMFAMRDDIARARFVTTNPGIRGYFQGFAARYCLEPPICDPWDPYRTADGSCNNLYNPLLGKSFTPQARIVPNAYNDCKFWGSSKSVVQSGTCCKVLFQCALNCTCIYFQATPMPVVIFW